MVSFDFYRRLPVPVPESSAPWLRTTMLQRAPGTRLSVPFSWAPYFSLFSGHEKSQAGAWLE